MYIVYSSAYAPQRFGSPDSMWGFVERVMAEGYAMDTFVIRVVPVTRANTYSELPLAKGAFHA